MVFRFSAGTEAKPGSIRLPGQGQAELDALTEMETNPKGAEEKCAAIWRIITGEGET